MWKATKQTKKEKETYIEYEFIEDLKKISFSTSLQENKKRLESLFNDCPDFVIRPFPMKP